jgi:hypothetical protein
MTTWRRTELSSAARFPSKIEISEFVVREADKQLSCIAPVFQSQRVGSLTRSSLARLLTLLYQQAGISGASFRRAAAD